MRKTLGRRGQGAAPDRARSAHADDSALRAGAVPAAVRLCAELRHPQRPAGGRGSRSFAAEPRAGVGVCQLRLFRPRGRRHVRARARAADRSQRGPRSACDSRPATAATSSNRRPVHVQVIVDGDNSNTATTVMGYAQSIVAEVAAAQSWRSVALAPPIRLEPQGLVQPAAAQHAVPRARPHRLHLDDHRRHLDRAVRRPREGARDDGAGEDVAGEPGGLRARQDDSVSRALVRVGASDHPRRDGALRSADARFVAAALRGASGCSSSARRRRVW